MFAKKRILKSGETAEATVLSVDERSHITSNELRDYDHVLEVRPDNGTPPFQATVRDKFWIVGLRPKAHDVLGCASTRRPTRWCSTSKATPATTLTCRRHRPSSGGSASRASAVTSTSSSSA